MIRIIALTCGTVGLALAVVDFCGWTLSLEKRLQDLKKKVLIVANVIAPREEVPQAHKDARYNFIQRIGPYEIALFFAMWLGFITYLLVIWWGNYHPTAEPGWGEFITLWIILSILALLVGLLLTFGALIAILFVICWVIVMIASLFELIAIPRRGIVGTLALIVAGASFVIELFLSSL